MLPFKQLVEVLGAAMKSVLELRTFVRSSQSRRENSPIAERFVECLIKLGPLYVKVGQIFSTRPDVMPKEYIATLERLQEHVPPMPFSEVEAVVRADFNGRPVGEVFNTFERTAIASASTAPVHLATLVTGEQVAVKIQRHGIDAQMRRGYNVRNAFAEFRRYTLQELDFTLEAAGFSGEFGDRNAGFNLP